MARDRSRMEQCLYHVQIFGGSVGFRPPGEGSAHQYCRSGRRVAGKTPTAFIRARASWFRSTALRSNSFTLASPHGEDGPFVPSIRQATVPDMASQAAIATLQRPIGCGVRSARRIRGFGQAGSIATRMTAPGSRLSCRCARSKNTRTCSGIRLVSHWVSFVSKG